jgi:DNA ligase (NAD+)
MEEKLLQMKSLVERLNQASDSYYNGKGELMTDYEWDALFDQLKRLEEETGKSCLTPLLIACQKILS